MLEFVLVAVGASLLISRSLIFQPIRNLLKFRFLKCDQCLSFWAGAIVSFAFSCQIDQIISNAIIASAVGWAISEWRPNITIQKG